MYRLADASLAANHDLRIALGRLVAARAARRQSLFDFAPTVTASAGYSRQEIAAAASPLATGYASELYDAGFDAAWELDLFGRIRPGNEAAHAQPQVASAQLRDAQVAVTAEVVRTHFELRGQQDQLIVARRNVENQQQSLSLTSARLSAGRGTQFDAAQLSSTLATIARLEAAVSRSSHRLGVLTGRKPNTLQQRLGTAQDLPALPELTAVGGPTSLLRRRPDIRAAERRLAAATAQVGEAVGGLFPRVTFTGNFGYTSNDGDSLGQALTRSYLIGPGISWAAFDLGRVPARIAGAWARDALALAAYEPAILRAPEDTGNALLGHARARERLAHTDQAARSSATAARIARPQYEREIVDFIEVLDADRTQLEAEDPLAKSRTAAMTSLAAVYKALGGGWEAAPLPRYTGTSGRTSGSGSARTRLIGSGHRRAGPRPYRH